MRVLLVTGIFPPDHGGPARYVPAIAAGLQKLGHEIVATVTLSDSLGHAGATYGFPVVRLRRGEWRPVRWLRTIATIWRLSRSADVVYLNGLVLEGIVAAKLIGRRATAVKVVGDLIWERASNQRVTQLDIDAFQRAPLSPRWRILRWLQGWYTGCADVVITPSHYLSGIVAGWGVEPSRLRVVYNAVPAHEVSAPTLPMVDIVSVARLVPWKGLADLIAMAGSNGWSMRIVGDGPLRGELEAQAKRVRAQVSFTGHIPAERVADAICSGRVFVLFSSYEGLPHIVLEAKGAGVVVVASAAGGTPETIDHERDGYLVPVGDRAALAVVLRRLLTDEALRAVVARRGKESVGDRFSFERMLRDTAAVLAETVSI